MPEITAWQVLGYLLLDTVDQYRIDTVGLCLTRSGILARLARRRIPRPARGLPP